MSTNAGQNLICRLNINSDPAISRFNIDNQGQWDIEKNIVEIIYESFITPADEDYLTARLLARKGLHRGFFWGASQAIEKYLKGFLLLRGHDVRRFNHAISPLFNEACNIDSSIGKISIECHPSLNIDQRFWDQFGSMPLVEFIALVEESGNPDNRYNASGIDFETRHLFLLDSLVFKLREKIEVPTFEYTVKNFDKDLIAYFKDNNPNFSNSTTEHSVIPSPQFPVIFDGRVTKLEFLKKHKKEFTYNVALQWLNSKMKLPKGTFP